MAGGQASLPVMQKIFDCKNKRKIVSIFKIRAYNGRKRKHNQSINGDQT